MSRGLKIGINVALLIIAIIFSYKIYESIMKPIKFRKAFDRRSKVVQQKMLRIRDAEVAYLDTYGKYTGSFDTLVNFIKHDSLRVVKSIGVVPDSIYLKAKSRKDAELKAIKLGIISRDTIKISVKDSLFKNYNVDTLRFVPYTNLKEDFQLRAGMLKTMSNAIRPVFELKVHDNTFTKGLDRQQVININDAHRDNNEYPGYIVGSMDEVTTSGNWD
jgi:hypothetical protein